MLTGTWNLDAERESAAIRAYVWSRRPNVMRWPFLTVLVLVGAVVGALAWTGERVLGWVLFGILAAMLVLVLVLRFIVRRGVDRAFAATGLETGVPCRVDLDDAGWHSDARGERRTYPWRAGDEWGVVDGRVIVSVPAPKSWVPERVLVVPLDAFGADASKVEPFLASRGLQPSRSR